VSDEAKEEAGLEPESPPSRVAGVLVLLLLVCVGGLILRVIVRAAPYTAYFVAGVIVTATWYKARAWRSKRRGGDGDEEEELDVVEALQHLGGNGDHVLLTQLQKRLGVKDTKAVRALLKAEKIRVRPGVRAPKGNGPGVHKDDIPTPPPHEETPSESGCSCSSGPTTPTPTTGTTVEAIGLAGVVVKDGSEPARQHRV
jgi:hypothetical protein